MEKQKLVKALNDDKCMYEWKNETKIAVAKIKANMVKVLRYYVEEHKNSMPLEQIQKLLGNSILSFCCSFRKTQKKMKIMP